ncbi:TonB-dependent receptor [Hymenobacter sp. BT507]|uniref:TonB-dependent receptor n=1 Tax=Hymenobacter citatus TaxID=2763506 RepID=A0ABR7MKL7_9BACT|nr:TonB-dependent receptor [Hymenobacter citatus]MBC6611630.1 TonB-dependent receptor [Hymenobacter citatus]
MRQTFLRNFMLLLLMIISAPVAWSQITTSAMNGVITDKTGMGLPGATVIAVHTPTNTQYVAPTNAEGRFTIQGMRVGGPYTVRITFVGYQDVNRDNIFLTLGQNLRLDVNLSESTQELGEVVVNGRRGAIINSDRTGSVTAVQREQIERLPSISRSLNDFTRLTPQANGTSIGGGNFRQNNFTVDGADFNNNFGIGGNLPANGTPISLDAIEQITVGVSPYDVRQSGFVGSAINAVTRSGSNNVSGSVYTYYRNQDFNGRRVGDERLVLNDTRFTQYGFRLGGPIIKDKLFFFVNGEFEKNTTPGQQRVAATPQSPYTPGSNSVTRPTAEELNGISNYLQNTFDYSTGPYQGYNFTANRNKLLGRLDWNISQNHRINVRYNQTEGKTPSFPSNSSSPLSNFATGASRTDPNALPFRSANYFQEANFYSLAGEWNSTFGATIANTLRATYTKQNDPRSAESTIFPFVDILKDGQPFTSFGYEPFSYGNLRDVEIYSIRDDFSWTLGKHNLTLGGQYDYSKTQNGFQRFGTSYYRFDSFQAFQNANDPAIYNSSDPNVRATAIPSAYAITYSLSPGFQQAFPTFKFNQYSLYAQDEYAFTEQFRVTAGLRAELTRFPESLKEHPLVSALTFANNEKINVANLPKSRVLLSPRVGFNWDVNGDQTVQLRGGTGIFTGKIPYVWVVSQAGDAGLLQITQTYTGAAAFNTTPSAVTVPGGWRGFSADPAFYRPATPPVAGTVIPNPISAIARDFRFPQTWKTSLAVDTKLPGGIIGSLEGIYNKDLNTALFRNANLVDPQNLNISNYPDTRLIYPNSNADKFINPIIGGKAVANGTRDGGAFNAIVLDNASKGYYWSLAAKLEKQFDNGLFASASYVRSEAKNLFDGSGDQPLSAWQLTPTVNGANRPVLAPAGYVVPNRVIASLSYRKEYINHLATTVSLFYEGSNQGRFSYVYSADFNRDGANADLIYIPRNASEIRFVDQTIGTGSTARVVTAQEQSDLFFKYIAQDKYLSKHQGSYAERNGALLPWRNQVDIKLLQDLFTNIGNKRNTLQLSLDIFNLGNFLNKDWGLVRTTTASSILVPRNVGSLSSSSNTVPTFQLQLDRGGLPQETFRNTFTTASTYYMQVGLRYIFN